MNFLREFTAIIVLLLLEWKIVDGAIYFKKIRSYRKSVD